MTPPSSLPRLGAIVRKTGVLRAAINTGNKALVQIAPSSSSSSDETASSPHVDDPDRLRGVSPALARRLASELDVAFAPILYDSAGKVFRDLDNDVWDVAFMAFDETRAQKVSFTRPYHSIEATFAVRTESKIENIDEVDREGCTILSSKGSAYDLFLEKKSPKHAKIQRLSSPTESFAEFRDGKGDAVAGVRDSLAQFFGGAGGGDDDDSKGRDGGVRILEGALTKVEQAMVLSGPDHPAIGELDDFVRRASEDGFVARELAKTKRTKKLEAKSSL